MLKVLDLFSGIGGFSLGLERTGGFKTVAFCEIEPFCRQVLKKHWPDVPIFDDVRTLKGSDVGDIDVICGGYPCQPFSLAGKRLGAADDRHLWPEYFRLVQELRPTWVIGENVAGHINMGLDDVLSDLEGAGYATRTFVIPAVAVDAKHRRDRLWIVGHANNPRSQGSSAETYLDRIGEKVSNPCAASGNEIFASNPVAAIRGDVGGIKLAETELSKYCDGSRDDGRAQTMAHPSSCGCTRQGKLVQRCGCASSGKGQAVDVEPGCERAIWSPEPNVGRVANGIPRRVDRLRSLGNAVVPQIPEMIGRAILKTYMENHNG